jgi:hypothetical protein
MDDLFESAWLKWAQAVINAKVLEDNINELARQGALNVSFGMTQEYDPKRRCIVLRVGPGGVPRILPIHWGLLLGDIVHNYRSSLDHLAWALYKRGRTPSLSKWQEQGVYFPIATTRDQFNSWLVGKRPKLPGVRRTDIAIVRRYQPYKRGPTVRRRHVLKVLDDLAIADKHRTIQPVQAIPERAMYRLLGYTDCIPTGISPRSRRVVLRPSAELGRICVRKTGPNPEIDVEPHFTVDPAINERLGIEEWAVRTRRIVGKLLSEFSPPPESLETIVPPDHGVGPLP